MTFNQLLKKIADDQDFRNTLVHDPEKALKDAGVDPTPEMIGAIKGIDVKSMEAVATAFGNDPGQVHADTLAIC